MTKNKLLMIFFTLFIYSTVSATSQENFLRANQLYINSDYAHSQKLYETIDNKGAAVLFNLGNCCYHLEQYPEALAYWKRSLKIGGKKWYNDVMYNCSHVQEILSVQQQQKWYELIVQTITYYSLLWWQLLVILLGIIGIAMLFLYKQKSTMLLTVFFCMVSMTTGCLGIKYWHLSQERAIVAYESGIMAGTDERFSKIALLKKGTEVGVVAKQERWIKITTNENAGWIAADALIII